MQSPEIRDMGSSQDMETLQSPPHLVDMLGRLEKDAVSVAESLNHLLASISSLMSQSSDNTFLHLECLNDAASLLHGKTLEAASKGNKFVNSCLRLNEEMKDLGETEERIRRLRQRLDQFELVANRILPKG